MEIIEITPEELRITAAKLRDEAKFLTDTRLGWSAYAGAVSMAKAYRMAADKYCALADKLEADKLHAMTFCAAKVEGVQA